MFVNYNSVLQCPLTFAGHTPAGLSKHPASAPSNVYLKIQMFFSEGKQKSAKHAKMSARTICRNARWTYDLG